MTEQQVNSELDLMLRTIAQQLDLSEARYANAEEKYRAIGDWLDVKNSPLVQYSPRIYPQGSFLLGTVVKPISSDEDFDIDLVCELSAIPEQTAPSVVKKMVGDRLKSHQTYRERLEEKNRCWRINYAGDFHLDIIPSIADVRRGGTAILVPDRSLQQWTASDPKGYAEWFRQRMAVQIEKSRLQLSEDWLKAIEEIPDYLVKTPLQQAIQLLKRHRDIQFIDDSERKPISIIITTLAGQSYRNQDNLFETLMFLVADMPNHIRAVGGVSWIPNPVNAAENFADKWQEHPDRREAFFDWLTSLSSQLNELEQCQSLDERESLLQELFGESDGNKSADAEGSKSRSPKIITSPPKQHYHVQFDIE